LPFWRKICCQVSSVSASTWRTNLLGVVGRRRRAALLDPRRRHRRLVEHHARIDPEIHRHQRQHDGAEADAAPADRQATASAAVLDVAAFPAVVETHEDPF
jgi:hypothetical protein